MLLLLHFVTRRHSPFSNRYIFDVLLGNVNVFSDERTFLICSRNFIWKSFLTLQNLIFITKSTRSSSNGINSLSCRGRLLLFKPYTESLAQSSSVSLLLFMKKITFHRRFFINNSIFSITCGLKVLSFGAGVLFSEQPNLLFPFD